MGCEVYGSWLLRVRDISQLLGRGEGEFLNLGMRYQESGHARGPSRKPQGSKLLGPEKRHLLKGASGVGEARAGRGLDCGQDGWSAAWWSPVSEWR